MKTGTPGSTPHAAKKDKKEFTKGAVAANVFNKLLPIPMIYTAEERRELEKKAQHISSRYFKSADHTATCSVVIVDNAYNIYVHTGNIGAGAVIESYSYSSNAI
ncbi:hypothetical protein [Chitinophaga nivalis]|uniref:Uncharacterized protein n=1 Tax=Chitinophaga nivalis TaxID=2991709 RepID=A0ABT3IW85_9BACT|nr:hypothetical protein [Chitinophaga nivalis]MCW3462062.1 hypothetical protein [Chitinophaga nivalis]MCW3488246.1 hypothetical protein [Chitinophaga nivalis]